MSQPEQPSAQKKKSRRKLYAVVGVVVIVIIIIAVLASLATPKTATFITSGTVETLSAGQYYSTGFVTNVSGTLTGTITTTNGITFYLLNPAEYANYTSSGIISSYIYTTGHIGSGSINTNIPSGTWYAVYDNTNLITSTTITIGLSFTS